MERKNCVLGIKTHQQSYEYIGVLVIKFLSYGKA